MRERMREGMREGMRERGQSDTLDGSSSLLMKI